MPSSSDAASAAVLRLLTDVLTCSKPTAACRVLTPSCRLFRWSSRARPASSRRTPTNRDFIVWPHAHPQHRVSECTGLWPTHCSFRTTEFCALGKDQRLTPLVCSAGLMLRFPGFSLPLFPGLLFQQACDAFSCSEAQRLRGIAPATGATFAREDASRKSQGGHCAWWAGGGTPVYYIYIYIYMYYSIM